MLCDKTALLITFGPSPACIILMPWGASNFLGLPQHSPSINSRLNPQTLDKKKWVGSLVASTPSRWRR